MMLLVEKKNSSRSFPLIFFDILLFNTMTMGD